MNCDSDRSPVGTTYFAPGYFHVLGWLLVVLAALGALGSFITGEDVTDAAIRLALNPLVWAVLPGALLLRKWSVSGVAVRCPLCGATNNEKYLANKRRGYRLTCRRCKLRFVYPGVWEGPSPAFGEGAWTLGRTAVSRRSSQAARARSTSRSGDTGTISEAASSNGFAIAGLTLGLIAVVLYFVGIIPLLAIVFSSIGLAKAGSLGGKGRVQSWIGLALGVDLHVDEPPPTDNVGATVSTPLRHT